MQAAACRCSIHQGSYSNTTASIGRRRMMQVLSVVGDTFADIVCRPLEKLPEWGTDTLVREPIRVMLGGSAANFAVHAATLNQNNTRYNSGDGGERPVQEPATDGKKSSLRQSCLLHSSVGTDQMGQFVRQQLAEAHVELSQAKQREHQGACIVLSGKKDRGFITHRGSCAEFCREDIDVARLTASSHVHIAGFYNCPALAPDLPRLLVEAREMGATCSLGPQWDASEEWGGLDEIYPLLDVFMPNEDEAIHMSGRKYVKAAAEYFLEKGVRLVVVTRGGSGAFAMSATSPLPEEQALGGRLAAEAEKREDKAAVASGSQSDSATSGQRFWEQSCTSVDVVDTTGAGDAFSAGFLNAWKATGGDVQVALRWGCALGTALVTTVGASPRLSVDEDIAPHLVF